MVLVVVDLKHVIGYDWLISSMLLVVIDLMHGLGCGYHLKGVVGAPMVEVVTEAGQDQSQALYLQNMTVCLNVYIIGSFNCYSRRQKYGAKGGNVENNFKNACI